MRGKDAGKSHHCYHDSLPEPTRPTGPPRNGADSHREKKYGSEPQSDMAELDL
jgi:hypothetical protein